MNAAQNADILWYILALVLVGSALLSRRMSMGSVLRMALGWVAIFGVTLYLYSHRDMFSQIGQQVKEQVPALAADQKIVGQALHISMANDGHFWVEGKINGTAARFLIDSGATITAISEQTARNAGLNIDANGPGVMIQTANGSTMAQRSNIAGLTVGAIQASDLPVIVSDRFGDVNVLGMNFLSRLKSWRVERGEMILEP